jgi:hypothetical protein
MMTIDQRQCEQGLICLFILYLLQSFCVRRCLLRQVYIQSVGLKKKKKKKKKLKNRKWKLENIWLRHGKGMGNILNEMPKHKRKKFGKGHVLLQLLSILMFF